MLALMMMEQYARRSAVRSGSRMRTIEEYVLKHITHSWIDDICFLGRALSVFPNRSKTVGSGAPSCDGSKSRKWINSFFQIRSANFLGTGGEQGPTLIAPVDCVVWGALRAVRGVVRGTSSGGSAARDEVMVCMPARVRGSGSWASGVSGVLCVCWAPVEYE